MNIQEGTIIYMVYVACLKEDVQCNKPLHGCSDCCPEHFRAHISNVVYTHDKQPLLGVKYFVEYLDAVKRKEALEAELRALRQYFAYMYQHK